MVRFETIVASSFAYDGARLKIFFDHYSKLQFVVLILSKNVGVSRASEINDSVITDTFKMMYLIVIPGETHSCCNL